MEWSTLEPRLGSWASKIKPFHDRGGFKPIYEFLKGQSKIGAKIAPISLCTYRVFKEVKFEDLKAVLICQDTYFKFIGDVPVASGIALDCSATEKIAPSLQQFYNGIEREIYQGLNLEYVPSYDMSYLTEQGVLLLNASLTVEKDKPGSHMKIWEDFTIFLLKEVIAPTGVPVLFLGREACLYEPIICITNPTFCAKHPVSAAYTGGCWDTGGAFSWLNTHIWNSNKDVIIWLPGLEPPF